MRGGPLKRQTLASREMAAASGDLDSHAPLQNTMSSSTSNCVRPKLIDCPMAGTDALSGARSERGRAGGGSSGGSGGGGPAAQYEMLASCVGAGDQSGGRCCKRRAQTKLSARG